MKVVLTGPKGSGKSSIVKEIMNSFDGRIAGFRTSRGETLCTMVDLVTGEEAIIARGSSGNWKPEPTGFLEVGIPSLEHSIEVGDLVVMDELGGFEDRVPEFQAAVLNLLGSKKDLLIVTQDKRTTFLESVRRHRDVLLHTVSLETWKDISKEHHPWPRTN
jgi:nucleoside-triphosphatase THEP1